MLSYLFGTVVLSWRIPRDIRQCLETIFFITRVGWDGMVLASSGSRSDMLLNVLQCTEKCPHTHKCSYPTQNFYSAKVEKPWFRTNLENYLSRFMVNPVTVTQELSPLLSFPFGATLNLKRDPWDFWFGKMSSTYRSVVTWCCSLWPHGTTGLKHKRSALTFFFHTAAPDYPQKCLDVLMWPVGSTTT